MLADVSSKLLESLTLVLYATKGDCDGCKLLVDTEVDEVTAITKLIADVPVAVLEDVEDVFIATGVTDDAVVMSIMLGCLDTYAFTF